MKKFISGIYESTFQVLKSDGILILVTFLLTEFAQRFILEIKIRGAGDTRIVALSAVNSLMISLIESLVLCLIIPCRARERMEGAPRKSFWHYVTRHTLPLTIEGIRAFSVTLLWLIAFILPGIYKMVRLSFVPYIVVFDPKYDAGEVDTLKESERLTSGKTMLYVFLTFFLIMSIELAKEAAREKFGLLDAPHIVLGVILLFGFANVFFNVLLFQIYLIRKNVTS